MPPPDKWPILPAVPPLLLGALFLFEIRPWLLAQETDASGITPLVVGTAIVWALVLWWALHHLVYQLAALAGPARHERAPPLPSPLRIVILIPTRDDFSPNCVQSCVDQDYPRESFAIVICDDSETTSEREVIDAYSRASGVRVLRRADRSGFKAGNLNCAMAELDGEGWDWIAIVDADQELPAHWLADLAPILAAQPADVAFVQAGREPVPGLQTPFQAAMGREMVHFFERDMSARTRYGFVPFHGHGGAIRATSWKRVGGLPPVVSEDYAFSCALWRHGLRGELAPGLRSAESYPVDFAAFVVRLGKFAAGAGELWFRRFPRYGPVAGRVTEWWDALMLFAGYALQPLILWNLPTSAYVCHVLWTGDRTVLAPNLSYLFLLMFGLTAAVTVSVHRNILDGFRRMSWSTTVYSAALPVVAIRFLAALFRRPAFHRTPKVVGHGERFRVVKWLIAWGGLAQGALAVLAWSPFSPMVLGYAVAQGLFPLWLHLHEPDSLRGRIARLAVHVPGGCLLVGLVGMWLWSTG